MKADHNAYLEMAKKCGLIEEHPVNHSSVEYIADLLKFADMVSYHENTRCFHIVSKQIPERDEDPRVYGAMCVAAYKVGSYE